MYSEARKLHFLIDFNLVDLVEFDSDFDPLPCSVGSTDSFKWSEVEWGIEENDIYLCLLSMREFDHLINSRYFFADFSFMAQRGKLAL